MPNPSPTNVSSYSLCGLMALSPEEARTIVTGSALHTAVTDRLIELSECVSALGDLLEMTDGQQLNHYTRANTGRLLWTLGDVMTYLLALLQAGWLPKD